MGSPMQFSDKPLLGGSVQSPRLTSTANQQNAQQTYNTGMSCCIVAHTQTRN